MIRKAAAPDIPVILALGRMMHAESRYSKFNYDEAKYRQLVTHIVANGIALLAEQNGEIIGVFLGIVRPHFFGNDLQASDFIQYIAPEHRGGMAGIRLIKEYIKEARRMGAKDICIANSSGIATERTGDIYRRLGFTLHGYDYSME